MLTKIHTLSILKSLKTSIFYITGYLSYYLCEKDQVENKTKYWLLTKMQVR